MVEPMTTRVLILGGYGNFGSYIARALKDDPAITLIIAGRSQAKAQAFVAGLGGTNPAEAAALDIGGCQWRRQNVPDGGLKVYQSG